MSDLIERLRDESSRQKDWADEGESIVVGNGPELLLQAADALAAKDAEIERLNVELDILESLYNASVRRVEQLQAVVDIHKKIMKYPTIRDFIGSILANKSDEAIAALEGGDGKPKTEET